MKTIVELKVYTEDVKAKPETLVVTNHTHFRDRVTLIIGDKVYNVDAMLLQRAIRAVTLV